MKVRMWGASRGREVRLKVAKERTLAAPVTQMRLVAQYEESLVEVLFDDQDVNHLNVVVRPLAALRTKVKSPVIVPGDTNARQTLWCPQ